MDYIMDEQFKFVSCNHCRALYRCNDTKIVDGFLYNIYSQFVGFKPVFHKKLKIYHNETHGYYVVALGTRCYMNGLKEELQDV